MEAGVSLQALVPSTRLNKPQRYPVTAPPEASGPFRFFLTLMLLNPHQENPNDLMQAGEVLLRALGPSSAARRASRLTLYGPTQGVHISPFLLVLSHCDRPQQPCLQQGHKRAGWHSILSLPPWKPHPSSPTRNVCHRSPRSDVCHRSP